MLQRVVQLVDDVGQKSQIPEDFVFFLYTKINWLADRILINTIPQCQGRTWDCTWALPSRRRGGTPSWSGWAASWESPVSRRACPTSSAPRRTGTRSWRFARSCPGRCCWPAARSTSSSQKPNLISGRRFMRVFTSRVTSRFSNRSFAMLLVGALATRRSRQKAACLSGRATGGAGVAFLARQAPLRLARSASRIFKVYFEIASLQPCPSTI